MKRYKMAFIQPFFVGIEINNYQNEKEVIFFRFISKKNQLSSFILINIGLEE